MTLKLILSAKDEAEDGDNILGGYHWYVISKRRGENGFPTLKGALEERWASEAWALICAKQRTSEGYASVEVYRQVAFTVSR